MVSLGVSAGQATLGGVAVGAGAPVIVMGALNVSPESFYRGSIHLAADDLWRAAAAMVEAGAALIDVGARSTAPYLVNAVGVDEERERLARAVEVLAAKLPVPISADTPHAAPARAALEAGARVINDVSGLADAALARLVAEHEVGLLAMASPAGSDRAAAMAPLAQVRARLADIVRRARAAHIAEERLVLDPGIGFFREGPVPWHLRDAEVLAGLATLAELGRPLAVGVSRKSFVGAITGRSSPAERLAGSLAATAIAVWNGAALIRTHDVAETLDAVRVAERLRRAAP